MKVIVPKIIDLKTACVNVHEWKHAHDLYQIIGKPMDKSDEDYEKSAKEMEKKFQKSIFSQK